jgi:hypothetical protein
MMDNEDPNYQRGVLVEKLLDVNKYKKWNNNGGYVDGMNEEDKLNLK